MPALPKPRSSIVIRFSSRWLLNLPLLSRGDSYEPHTACEFLKVIFKWHALDVILKLSSNPGKAKRCSTLYVVVPDTKESAMLLGDRLSSHVETLFVWTVSLWPKSDCVPFGFFGAGRHFLQCLFSLRHRDFGVAGCDEEVHLFSRK